MDYLDRHRGDLADMGWDAYNEAGFRAEEAAERAAREEATREPDGGCVAEHIDGNDDRPGWDPNRKCA